MKFYKDKIREFRKKKKISMHEFARLGKISRSSLSDWELGKKIPNEARVRMFAHILDVSVAEISDLEDKKITDTAEYDVSLFTQAWLNFADSDDEKWLTYFKEEMQRVQKRNIEMRQVSIIVKTLLAALPVMFYFKDKDQKYITANKAFLKNTSTPTDIDVQNKRDEFFFSNKEARENTLYDQKIMESGEGEYNYEMFIPGTRKKKWGIASKIPIYDNNKSIAGIIGVFVDITKRKEEERNRKVLERVINKSPNMFWAGKFLNRSNFEFLFLSENVESIFGISKEKFNFETWGSVLHPDYKYLNELKIFDGNHPPVFEYKIIHANGKERWILEKTVKVNDEIFGGIAVDITARKREDEIRELLDINIKNLPDPLIIIDVNTKEYLYTNRAVEKIYGYSEEKIKSGGVKFFLDTILHPDFREEHRKYHSQKDLPPYAKFKIIRPDGTSAWIESTGSVRKCLGRDCFIIVERDISKRMNEKLSRKILETAVKMDEKVITAYKIKTDKFKYVGDDVSELTGYSSREFLEHGFKLWLKCIHSDFKVKENEFYINKDWPQIRKIKLLHKDGTIIKVEIKTEIKTIQKSKCVISLITACL
jgi:PAS domain S-box-containing protein